jgi:hypothetical protein
MHDDPKISSSRFQLVEGEVVVVDAGIPGVAKTMRWRSEVGRTC